MGIALSSFFEVITRFGASFLLSLVPFMEMNEVVEIKTEALVMNKVDFAQRQITIEPIVIQKEEKPVIKEEQQEVVKEEKKDVEEKNTLTFSGRMTSYTAYCSGCSEAGNVACHTENGGKHSLKTNGQYYSDSQYGSVRILAADRSYPCGTIIRVTASVFAEPFIAVVLDRGGAIKGDLFDLAYEGTESGGFGVDRNVKYEVLRLGW